MVITETLENGNPTGWKLIRIPKTEFDSVGVPAWNDVPTFRIRLESTETSSQSLKIAKIELVENDWQEMGIAQKNTLSSYEEDPFFSVSVINTDESTEYKNSLDDLDIVLEICPTSNVATKIYASYKDHPVKELYDRGVKITVNSDDPPFFNATVAGEYKVMSDLGLSDSELLSLTHNAIHYSFCDNNTKIGLPTILLLPIITTCLPVVSIL